jgi:CubicO group peptidase (beta-lactamase class C family)
LNTITNKYPSLDFKTGSRFKYCNTNFVLLALLVEKLSGLSFPFYVKENIFDVAGMKDSYVLSPFNRGDYMPSFTAKGRMYNFDYLDGLYGDKNVYTTCRDLLKYDSAIRVGALLDPLAFEKAWEPNFRDTKYDEPWEYYGLGWRLKVFENNLKIPYHNGWWHGSNAVFQRLVADTAVIIVTGNRMNRKIYSSAKAANTFRTYYPDSLLQTMGEETESTLGDSLPGSAPGSRKAELPVGQTGSSTENHEKISSKTSKSPPGL